MGVGANFYFFNGHLRRAIAAFANVFSDMAIARMNSQGNIQSIIYPIPIRFANGDSSLLLNEGNVNHAIGDELRGNFHEVFPRMTFTMDNIQINTERLKSVHNRIGAKTPQGRRIYASPVPYTLSFTLNIIARNHFDAQQIFEQIIPYFQADKTITIKDFPAVNHVYDMPIVLVSTSMQDNYESGTDEKRRVIYSLEFETKIHFYGSSGQRIEYDAASMFIAEMNKKISGCEEDLKNIDLDDYDNKILPMYKDLVRRRDQVEENIDGLEGDEIENICLNMGVAEHNVVGHDAWGRELVFTPGWDTPYEHDLVEKEKHVTSATEADRRAYLEGRWQTHTPSKDTTDS